MELKNRQSTYYWLMIHFIGPRGSDLRDDKYNFWIFKSFKTFTDLIRRWKQRHWNKNKTIKSDFISWLTLLTYKTPANKRSVSMRKKNYSAENTYEIAEKYIWTQIFPYWFNCKAGIKQFSDEEVCHSTFV